MATSEHTNKNSLVIGKLGGVFGLQGWLKVISWCHPRENIFNYQVWQLVSPKKQECSRIELEQGKLHRGGKVLIVKLQGVDDINHAERFMGYQIHIDKALLLFKNNEFYWFELVGMRVMNLQQQSLGQVDGLLETGRHDVLQVKSEMGDYLIPYVREKVIKSIKREQGLIVVDWPIEWLA